MKPAETKTKSLSKNTPEKRLGSLSEPDAEQRLEYIRTAAYYKAEARQFTPGKELEDWLEAAAEFDART